MKRRKTKKSKNNKEEEKGGRQMIVRMKRKRIKGRKRGRQRKIRITKRKK